MKISKSRLKEIIKEELYRDDDDGPFRRGLAYENLANAVGDLARKALEEDGLDAGGIRDAIAEALAEELGPVQDEGPRVTSTGPWAPEKLQEEGRSDQGWLDALKQKYGRKAAHFTLEDIQDLHPSYKGSLRDVAQGLGIR